MSGGGPRAVALKAAIDGWIAGESAEQIRQRAARAYAKYQRTGLAAAVHLFSSTWYYLGMILNEFAKEGGGVFTDLAVVGAEGGEEVRVDIEFADHFAANENGNDDFGFGFEGTSEIAGIGTDVVNNDGFAGGGRGATDALIQRDARVGSHGALEGTEHEDVAIGFLFEHVETNPVVTSELLVQEGGDAFHETFGGGGGFGELVESRDQLGGLRECSCHGQ